MTFATTCRIAPRSRSEPERDQPPAARRRRVRTELASAIRDRHRLALDNAISRQVVGRQRNVGADRARELAVVQDARALERYPLDRRRQVAEHELLARD